MINKKLWMPDFNSDEFEKLLKKEYPEGRIYFLTNRNIFVSEDDDDAYFEPRPFNRVYKTAKEVTDAWHKYEEEYLGLWVYENIVDPKLREAARKEMKEKEEEFFNRINADKDSKKEEINSFTDYFRMGSK